MNNKVVLVFCAIISWFYLAQAQDSKPVPKQPETTVPVKSGKKNKTKNTPVKDITEIDLNLNPEPTMPLSNYITLGKESGWTPWEHIYQDSLISVEVQFKLTPGSCDQNSTGNIFRYYITGKLLAAKLNANWQMDYVGCDGILYTMKNSVKIGVGGNLGLIDLSSPKFTCSRIQTMIYEVRISPYAEFGTIIKKFTKPSDNQYGEVKDIDGNSYKTVLIGSQTWMSENLRTTRYNNGDIIPNLPDEDAWISADGNAWCNYENSSNVDLKLGKLYNWYAINDQRGICPKGWHVPDIKEWIILMDYLGGEQYAGQMLKTTQDWKDFGNGDNISGFSGLPAGLRRANGVFETINLYGYFWSSTERTATSARCIILGYNDTFSYRDGTSKKDGLSCRCIKD